MLVYDNLFRLCFLIVLYLINGTDGFGLSIFKDQTICRFTECCNDRYIPADINVLSRKLESALYGQHIVFEHLIPALKAHISPDSRSRKPLVISFHGTPGTGKNFVSDLIAESLYANGLKSKYVHKYMGRADFPLEADANKYKERLNLDVKAAIANCPRSLFIFDEVDKMPSGVFESLTSMVEYSAFLNGCDNTKAIYIFLSNTAGVQISDRLANLMKAGTLREKTKLSSFEQVLEVAAYNLEGGLKKASLIEAHVIDHYFPFLPLEKQHIYKCLEAEFNRWDRIPDQKVIERIIKDDVTYDKTNGLFVTSGCKKLEKKVAVEVMSVNKHEL